MVLLFSMTNSANTALEVGFGFPYGSRSLPSYIKAINALGSGSDSHSRGWVLFIRHSFPGGPD